MNQEKANYSDFTDLLYCLADDYSLHEQILEAISSIKQTPDFFGMGGLVDEESDD